MSKAEQEIVVNEFHQQKGVKMTIIRSAPIFGPYQTYGTYHIMLLLRVMGHSGALYLHPRKHRLMLPSIHIEDLALAALFISEKDEAIGEAYNVAHEPVWMDDWLEYLNDKLSIRYTLLPVWFPIYKFFARIAAGLAKLRNKKARKIGIRPILDLPMVKYVTHQYTFSNQKVKDLGYKFKFNTWTGFEDTINWYFKHGWLPTESNNMEVP